MALLCADKCIALFHFITILGFIRWHVMNVKELSFDADITLSFIDLRLFQYASVDVEVL